MNQSIGKRKIESYLNIGTKAEGVFKDRVLLPWKRGNYNPKEALVNLAYLSSSETFSDTNIMNPEYMMGHCRSVAGLAAETLLVIRKNNKGTLSKKDYQKAVYAAIWHDGIKIIENHTGRENNIHEVVWHAYLTAEGEVELADLCALHFVGPEVLDILKSEGKFTDVVPRRERLLTLVAISDADAGCAGGHIGFGERIEKMIQAYGEDTYIGKGLDVGGEERMKKEHGFIEKLAAGILDVEAKIKLKIRI